MLATPHSAVPRGTPERSFHFCHCVYYRVLGSWIRLEATIRLLCASGRVLVDLTTMGVLTVYVYPERKSVKFPSVDPAPNVKPSLGPYWFRNLTLHTPSSSLTMFPMFLRRTRSRTSHPRRLMPSSNRRACAPSQWLRRRHLHKTEAWERRKVQRPVRGAGRVMAAPSHARSRGHRCSMVSSV